MAYFANDAPDESFGSLLGPGQVDNQIRQALQLTWMSLPADRRTVSEVERVFRLLVDRALKDLRDDGATFGQGV